MFLATLNPGVDLPQGRNGISSEFFVRWIGDIQDIVKYSLQGNPLAELLSMEGDIIWVVNGVRRCIGHWQLYTDNLMDSATDEEIWGPRGL